MGNMVPWEPFQEMLSLREAMNRLFEESFLRPSAFGAGEVAGQMLPVDVFETDNNLVLKASVPGMKPEDLDVTITGDLLTIKGEYKSEEETGKGRNYLRQERRFGSFCRQLTLPATVDANKVSATFEDGVLTLDMAKKEQVKSKSVKIRTK